MARAALLVAWAATTVNASAKRATSPPRGDAAATNHVSARALADETFGSTGGRRGETATRRLFSARPRAQAATNGTLTRQDFRYTYLLGDVVPFEGRPRCVAYDAAALAKLDYDQARPPRRRKDARGRGGTAGRGGTHRGRGREADEGRVGRQLTKKTARDAAAAATRQYSGDAATGLR